MQPLPSVPRRRFLAGLAAAGVGLAYANPARTRRAESGGGPFVLVHGAWHGGWCWRKVVPLLRAAGHDVYAPTLTGLGDRRHLAGPEIGLPTHVEDVVALLEQEDLSRVVLVGHSYAGFVIGGVAARSGARLARLVYLDAFLPEDGKAVRDYLGARRLDDIVRAKGEGWRLPMTEVLPLTALGLRTPADVAWVAPRLADQPYRTFTEPLSPAAIAAARALPCAYVLTSEAVPFRQAAERAHAQGCASRALSGAGHDAMITNPHGLAAVLIGLAP